MVITDSVEDKVRAVGDALPTDRVVVLHADVASPTTGRPWSGPQSTAGTASTCS